MQTGFSQRISQTANHNSKSDSSRNKSGDLHLSNALRKSGILVERQALLEDSLVDFHEKYQMGCEDIIYYFFE